MIYINEPKERGGDGERVAWGLAHLDFLRTLQGFQIGFNLVKRLLGLLVEVDAFVLPYPFDLLVQFDAAQPALRLVEVVTGDDQHTLDDSGCVHEAAAFNGIREVDAFRLD